MAPGKNAQPGEPPGHLEHRRTSESMFPSTRSKHVRAGNYNPASGHLEREHGTLAGEKKYTYEIPCLRPRAQHDKDNRVGPISCSPRDSVLLIRAEPIVTPSMVAATPSFFGISPRPRDSRERWSHAKIYEVGRPWL